MALSNCKVIPIPIPIPIPIGFNRTCTCPPAHTNCMTAKEWLKSQIGVWQVSYEKRDIRDKKVHPATFPIKLAKKVIELFTHEGELVLDPFAGSGTTLIAAQDLHRNAVGFDLQEKYIKLCKKRLAQRNLFNNVGIHESQQIPIQDNAQNVSRYFNPETVSLLWTSPPYANLLDKIRKNKSRHDNNKKNEQYGYGKNEQYSQNKKDLGTMCAEKYIEVMGDIYSKLLPLLKPKAHCVINVLDIWKENKRITLHVSLIKELEKHGYELRNIIIWDKTNLVNGTGIFGWPSNYITMGITFEYLLDFWKPPANYTVSAIK